MENGLENAERSLIKAVSIEAIGRLCGDCRRTSAPAPRSGRSCWRDVIKYDQNWIGSLSPSSSENQVTQRGLFGIHSLSNVVLPNPAGAAMRVIFRSRPAFKHSINRGRETIFDRGRGVNNLVLRISTMTLQMLAIEGLYFYLVNGIGVLSEKSWQGYDNTIF